MYQNNKDFNLDAVDFGLIDSMRFEAEDIEKGFPNICKISQYPEKVGRVGWTVRNSQVEQTNTHGMKTHVITFTKDSGLPGEDYIFYFTITAATFDVKKDDIVRILAYINSYLYSMESIALQKNWSPNYSFARDGALKDIMTECISKVS